MVLKLVVMYITLIFILFNLARQIANREYMYSAKFIEVKAKTVFVKLFNIEREIVFMKCK